MSKLNYTCFHCQYYKTIDPDTSWCCLIDDETTALSHICLDFILDDSVIL